MLRIPPVLANKLTFSSSACVHDISVTIPIFGSFTIQFLGGVSY
ncbi:hypothetical protein J595_03994 [Acinetobacter sp. 1592897]|nr:hypothetical protein J595_03994 [Acinetobacter sp. 1592897]